MTINANKITEIGLFIEDNVEMDENLLVEDDSYFLENIGYSIKLVRDGEKINAKGIIKTTVSVRCTRCLENYNLKVNSKFDIILFPANLIELSSVALDNDDMEYIFYENDNIDIEKILIEQINLFIPPNPVCLEQCKGICPTCGTNLNDNTCNCENSLHEVSFFVNKIK